MNRRMKSLLLLAIVVASMGSVAQTASASDRFDVVVQIVSFKSLVDMDPSNAGDEYYITLHADISGVGRRSLYRFNLNGEPKRVLLTNRQVTFRNIREPSRSDRRITLYSDVSEKDVITKKKLLKKPKKIVRYDDMGAATRRTSDELFRNADRSRNDIARETVWLTTGKYRMEVRVTVKEVD